MRNNENLPIVKVKITLSKTGTLRGISFIEKSDNDYYNWSIRNAIINSKPYPPFPAGMKEENLDMTINFDAKR